MKIIKKAIKIAIFSLIFGSSIIFIASNAQAEPDKQYRSGRVFSLNGKNYSIANNSEFAEILEITPDNKLAQVSEVHGMESIKDLYVGRYLNKYYLVVSTGRYLYRYDISDPKAPRIEFKRDLFTFKRGQFRIGSADSLAGNRNFIFTAGSSGVRSFYPDNLFVNKIYTFDKNYGLAADDNNLYVITESSGLVFDIASGAKLLELDLENKGKMKRIPAFDDSGNVYFPTDRGLIKANVYGGPARLYANPVPETEIFSYGAAVLPDGKIYYANGHGLTVLDKNFNKTSFLNTSNKSNFGADAWAVGLAAARLGAKEILAVLNKSSILLVDKNLKILAQYKYKKMYPDFITTSLRIVPSVNTASAGQKINLRLFGFWPNENVSVTFGKSANRLNVDNQGYASIDLDVPHQTSRQAIIQATGDDSRLTYQTVFTAL